MRDIAPALQAHLDGGVTTLCWCWSLSTVDGQAFGFTDHDRNVTFAGMTYEALSGFAASDIESSLGLSVDNLEASGALSSLALNEADLAAGRFDNATVAIWLVNWSDPAQRVLVKAGNLGEVRRGETAFTAEIRGVSHLLNQPMGRLFQYACDAQLGDARCGLDLANPAYSASALVTGAVDNRVFDASGIEAFADNWFTRGRLVWTSGVNAGRGGDVKRHRAGSPDHRIELWQPMAGPVGVGDQFTLTAGCDKQFATCRAKFANAVNFQGFPHMPGNDFVLSYARAGDAGNDGAAREGAV